MIEELRKIQMLLEQEGSRDLGDELLKVWMETNPRPDKVLRMGLTYNVSYVDTGSTRMTSFLNVDKQLIYQGLDTPFGDTRVFRSAKYNAGGNPDIVKIPQNMMLVIEDTI